MSTTALSLYTIEENLLALLDTVDLVEDEQQQIAILAEIAQANAQAVAKRDGVIKFHRHLVIQQGACKAEIDRLSALQRHYAAAQERLERYVVGIIQEFVPEPRKGSKRIEGSIGVLSLRKNPDSVEIINEAAVPEEYKTLTITVPAARWRALVEAAPEAVTAALGPLTEIKADCRVSKAEIKAELKAGAEIPGADLRFGELRLEVK